MSMAVDAAIARSAGDHRSVSTAVYAAYASSAGGGRSVSTAVYAADARSALELCAWYMWELTWAYLEGR